MHKKNNSQDMFSTGKKPVRSSRSNTSSNSPESNGTQMSSANKTPGVSRMHDMFKLHSMITAHKTSNSPKTPSASNISFTNDMSSTSSESIKHGKHNISSALNTPTASDVHSPTNKSNINQESHNHHNRHIHKLLKILYEIHKNRKKLVISFPGQSSQFLNMGMDFYEKDKDSRRIIDMADAHVKKLYGWSILNVICNDEKSLNDTTYSQICIFVVSVAIFAAFMNDMGDISEAGISATPDITDISAVDSKPISECVAEDKGVGGVCDSSVFENSFAKLDKFKIDFFDIDFFDDLRFNGLNYNKRNSGDSNASNDDIDKNNIDSSNSGTNSDINYDTNPSMNPSINFFSNSEVSPNLNARDVLSMIVNIVEQDNSVKSDIGGSDVGQNDLGKGDALRSGSGQNDLGQNNSLQSDAGHTLFRKNSFEKNTVIYEIFSFVKFLNDLRLFRKSVSKSVSISLLQRNECQNDQGQASTSQSNTSQSNISQSSTSNVFQSNLKEKGHAQNASHSLHNFLRAFDGIEHLIRKIFESILSVENKCYENQNYEYKHDEGKHYENKEGQCKHDEHISHDSYFLKNLDDYFAFFSAIEWGEATNYDNDYDYDTRHKNENIQCHKPDHTIQNTQNTENNEQSYRQDILQHKTQSFYNFLLNFKVFFCGHSLGEYSALCAAGVLNFFDCIDILHKRSQLMSKAEEGGMVAVIGSDEAANKLVEHGSKFGVCIKANQNCKGQVVLSGSFHAMDEVVKFATEVGVRAIRLNVSGAFHSSLMSSAQNSLQSVLKDKAFRDPLSVFFSSSTYRNDVMFFGKDIKEGIYNQMTYGVNWKNLMNSVVNDEFGRNDERFVKRLENAFVSILGDELNCDGLSRDGLKGCNDMNENSRNESYRDESCQDEKKSQDENTLFIEIGPGKVLSGFAKKHGYDNFNFSLSSEELKNVL